MLNPVIAHCSTHQSQSQQSSRQRLMYSLMQRFRAAVVLSLLLAPALTRAAPTVDTTWGTAGRVSFSSNGGTESTGQHVLPLADGKLLVLGFCTSQMAADYCVRRLNADGSNDTTFGTGVQGETVVNLGGQDFPLMMDLSPDGKIVIGGKGTMGQLVRLDANGTPDTTFGTNGIAGSGGVYIVHSLRVRGNGKIVYTGDCGLPASFCVGQLNANGTLDPTFNGGAVFSFTPAFTPPGKGSMAYALALAPDGSTYLGGKCDVGIGAAQRNQFCLAKITPSGALDTSFANGGTYNYGILGADDYIENGRSLALQADGKIIAAGRCRNPSTFETHLCIARYDNAGPDSTYGLGGLGYTLITFGPSSQTYSAGVTMQPDGKALIAASCNTAGRLCIVRLNDNGSVDQSFAPGVFSLQLGNATQVTDWGSGVVPAGSSGTKLIAYGTCRPLGSSTGYAPCLVRLNIDPPAGRQCSFDIDGDGRIGATTDGLLLLRVALGMTGNAVVAGAINPSGERSTWPLVQDYLTRHCGMNLSP
jgi:uncharacterized delta-60 repeat protein